jgi:hypothetical protein
MRRDQAEELHRHLLDAAAAMRRAEAAMDGIEGDDRKVLARPLAEVSLRLTWDLRHAIYRRYPELEPPRTVVPTINSELCWDDVVLPPDISKAELDAMIFPLLKPQWQKMLRILWDACEQCKERGWSIEAEVVAARIQALADDDLIDHRGDLRMWGFSEVRLIP